LLVLVALAAAPAHGEPSDDASVLPLSSALRVVVQDGRQLELEVQAGGRETYASIADRVCSGPGDGPALAAWNAGRALGKGDWVRVPLSLLHPRFRSLVLRRTFPEDYLDDGDWIHVARSGPLAVYDQGMWQVATWFAREEGQAFARLMRINDLDSPELSIGQRIRIPGDLLHPAFQAGDRSHDDVLEYGTDGDGPYAAYRLQAGEALYSAVVLRFTGRTDADDVRQVAELVARRSAIRDPRDIPVGYEIRIPLNLLEPDHLPSGHPRRLEAEAQRAELERVLDRRPVRGSHGGLDDVVIIIDPGHGGRDLGTQHDGIWEHD